MLSDFIREHLSREVGLYTLGSNNVWVELRHVDRLEGGGGGGYHPDRCAADREMSGSCPYGVECPHIHDR